MKDFYVVNKILVTLILCFLSSNWSYGQKVEVDTRIDNWRYWVEMAELNLIPYNENKNPEPAEYKGTLIKPNAEQSGVDSPDIVLITGSGISQSENSVFVNPIDNEIILASNNSTIGTNPINLTGTNALFSFDGGANWIGGTGGAGGTNRGDPAAAVDLDGNSYIGHITNTSGQGVSVSTNNGGSFSSNIVSTTSFGLLDKNHLWIDNSLQSGFQGNLYNAWTPINTNLGDDNQIVLSRSTNNGLNWSPAQSISDGVSAGNFNQGVSIQTGPNGEVYAIWAIYDNNFPSRENAIGFARSLNGGASFETATRIIDNIQGARWQPGFPFTLPNVIGKNMRVNSFPVMAVDISGGPNNGNIYVVWSNIGFPGINTGSDVSIYMIRSTTNGNSWSSPIRINQDAPGNIQYFPWITCDPVTGDLSVIFYDDRNTGSAQVETWVATSTDAGNTWENFRVSDVAFTPAPIPGLAGGYMGDYLGISARGGTVYPVWTDNRSGQTLTYTSPFEIGECLDDITITENVSSGSIDQQEANNTITASNTIFSGGEANYNAGERVTLISGFNARRGSSFRAIIEGCSGGTIQEAETKLNTEYVKQSKPRQVEYFESDSNTIQFKIYPNPSKGIFTVDLQGNNTPDKFEIQIYSISRGLIYTNIFETEISNSFQTDISKLPEGIYIIKLINQNTGEIFTGKVNKTE